MTHYISMANVEDTLENLGVDLPDWMDTSITVYELNRLINDGLNADVSLHPNNPVDTLGDNWDDVQDVINQDREYAEELAREQVNVPTSLHDTFTKLLLLATAVWAKTECILDEVDHLLEAQIDQVAQQWPEIRAMIVEQYSEDDEPALNEGFNNWLDALYSNGELSDYVVNNLCRDEIE